MEKLLVIPAIALITKFIANVVVAIHMVGHLVK